MLSEADRAVLDESFQNTRMAGEAIHMVIGKVEDEDLALDLNRQACSSRRNCSRCMPESM